MKVNSTLPTSGTRNYKTMISLDIMKCMNKNITRTRRNKSIDIWRIKKKISFKPYKYFDIH